MKILNKNKQNNYAIIYYCIIFYGTIDYGTIAYGIVSTNFKHLKHFDMSYFSAMFTTLNYI